MIPTPRFLCDEMLGQLCRYLRAAGYDTLLANDGQPDRILLQQCHDEGRFFLTQDQLIREHKAARNIALILPQGNTDELAAILGTHFHLDWLDRAFTRCLVDNTPLLAADAVSAARVPPDALRPNEPLTVCPLCERVYWQGSHFKRMHARLARWQAENT
ncbi:MAG: hypothetical protein KKH12_08055 [Gammaproteobacteria bacterium]|nr:hypothetical protein [Gammaproteobacteria bacterium]MBU1481615.1 hypothetical protein [Gammaproteobacteria bacterium]